MVDRKNATKPHLGINPPSRHLSIFVLQGQLLKLLAACRTVDSVSNDEMKCPGVEDRQVTNPPFGIFEDSADELSAFAATYASSLNGDQLNPNFGVLASDVSLYGCRTTPMRTPFQPTNNWMISALDN